MKEKPKTKMWSFRLPMELWERMVHYKDVNWSRACIEGIEQTLAELAEYEHLMNPPEEK